ncbi:MAG: C40 family peptidase [Gemmatimonadaceae bacterium]
MTKQVVVIGSYAPMHAEPKVSSPQLSQALGGHALAVLESQGDWHQVRGDDGYSGWIHAGYLAPVAPDVAPLAPHAPLTTSRAERLTSLGCIVRNAGERRRVLPPAALLLPEDTVESGRALAADALRGEYPSDPAAAARTATSIFEGTPYLWGGTTPWGADCSGLVQTTFRLHGLVLPRDAWQQAAVGDDAGTDPLALRAGDLLFFSDRDDRRITHVGIATGDRGMVHAALGRGGFAVERLDDTDDLYVEKLRARFTGARRVKFGGA